MALIDKLSAIGDAIREKNGTTDLIPLGDMPAAIQAIETGGNIEVEPMVLTGMCRYEFSGKASAKYVELYGNTITTSGITESAYMFYGCQNTTIPFDININNTTYRDMSYMFMESLLTELPKINNAYPSALRNLFQNCRYLKTIPEDWVDTWNFSRIYSNSSATLNNMFGYCSSLRNIPEKILSKFYNSKNTTYSRTLFYYGFTYDSALDEIVGLAVDEATMISNMFVSTFENCGRLKNVIFKTNEDGSAQTANWKGQVITLSNFVGYPQYNTNILNYSSTNGITADKEVIDDATYQALKDDADWFSCNVAYSRYNHDSAVATINSLPDTSAYLATAGGTNTIKFKGAAGSLTDGGAISNLTEEEIAVATAKGWTVTLT